MDERYHRRFLADWARMGISFDLFTHTDTEQHAAVARDIFRALYDRGTITLGTMTQLYCETDRRFLPDRYVEGTCPHCGYANARGDQCDTCGRTLDAIEIADPRCRLCGRRPVPRETAHFFLDLPALQEQIRVYIEAQTQWRPNVRNFALRYVQGGLRSRAVSRDLTWGIPLPIPGYEDKVMYVWFEDVNRYLDEKAPWFQIKTDRQAAATTIFVALRAIDSLKTLVAPVLPFTSERVHGFLGRERPLFGHLAIERIEEGTRAHEVLRYHPLPDEGTVDRWRPSTLEAGRPLARPSALFEKLDAAPVARERERLGGAGLYVVQVLDFYQARKHLATVAPAVPLRLPHGPRLP